MRIHAFAGTRFARDEHSLISAREFGSQPTDRSKGRRFSCHSASSQKTQITRTQGAARMPFQLGVEWLDDEP